MPVTERLFTSMNPVDVKIWIPAWWAFHTKRLRALTTIVPSRPLPSPANLRSRRPLVDGAAGAGVEAAPADVAVVGAA